MWITECGTKPTIPGDFLNAERRAYQAEFTIETAKQALAAEDVAVFMPFILVHKGDPHTMVVAETVTPLPAWDAYAEFTRENPWPQRGLSVRAGARVNPVVVQWMPAEGTASHKVAGTYRVGEGGELTGTMRVFNFGEEEVAGTMSFAVKHGAVAHGPEAGGLIIPPMGQVEVPVVLTPAKAEGYFRDEVTVRFREKSGRIARAAFGVERVPHEDDFTAAALALRRLAGESRAPRHTVQLEGESMGPWRVFNGLRVEEAKEVSVVARRAMAGPGKDDGRGTVASGGTAQPAARRFSIGTITSDPLAPIYAVAALEGVPKGAKFLRVRFDRPMRDQDYMRVDLIDTDGQRFTIWENMGMVYGPASNEVWLGLEDFHPYFWSTAVPGKYRIDPQEVRELQMRFFFHNNEGMEVGLEWMTAR